VSDIDPVWHWIDGRAKLERQGPLLFETTHVTKSGREYPAEVHLNQVHINGNPYCCATAIDISERKRSDAALRQSEAKLKTILAVAPVGIAIIRDRQFLQVNDGYCRIFGRAEHEFLHQSTRLLYATDEEFQETGRIGYPNGRWDYTIEIEVTGRRADGSTFPLMLHGASLNPNSSSEEVVLLAVDMSGTKRTEQALRESEAMLRALVRAAPIGIATLRDRTLEYVSDGLCKIFGRTSGELLNHSARILYSTDAEFERAGLAGYAQTPQNPEFEATCLRGDGTTFPVLYHARLGVDVFECLEFKS
jgi:PAS domain S-box-containing protein